ncbi:hypothetical protein PoB_006052700 [Plakobranchus ocellatus]|uniref:Uncharacterized protein n=1 Tax=Plakobranchus ocellatus TaxID=259542 RepID=A0AAV4CQ57_9GAST|nr:hypothetical protein PoB_006052700 [Plakobranchus ocellatus]
MPATPSERITHESSPYAQTVSSATALADHISDKPACDLNLTVSFLGCPSSSTSIRLPTSGNCEFQAPHNESGTPIQQDLALLTNESQLFNDSMGKDVPWQQGQEQNNNWCPGSLHHNVNATFGWRDECSGDVEVDDRESETNTLETLFNAYGYKGCNNSMSSDASDDSLHDTGNEKASAKNAYFTCLFSGREGSRKGNSRSSKTTHTTKAPFVSAGTLSQQAEPLEDPGPRVKKATATFSGCGRALLSRVQRSPKRNNSPAERRKGINPHGCSAPVPFVPNPVQGSVRFTNINRASSESPARRDELKVPDKGGKYRSPPARDSLENATACKFGKASKTDKSHTTSSRPNVAASPSLSHGTLAHRSSMSLPPAPSLAESDLRDHQPQRAKTPVLSAETLGTQCHLILPEKSWPNRASHGDFQQKAPKKMLEMSRLRCPQPKKLAPTPTSGAINVATPIPDAPSLKASPSQVESEEEVLTSSRSVITGSTSSRPRSSRRHPVLDKMFRHVLASLVMESGPPSSACLASVLEQVQSQTKASSASATDTITSPSNHGRFGGSGSYDLDNTSKAVTSSASTPLPCTLTKVNEDANCPPAQQAK